MDLGVILDNILITKYVAYKHYGHRKERYQIFTIFLFNFLQVWMQHNNKITQTLFYSTQWEKQWYIKTYYMHACFKWRVGSGQYR